MGNQHLCSQHQCVGLNAEEPEWLNAEYQTPKSGPENLVTICESNEAWATGGGRIGHTIARELTSSMATMPQSLGYLQNEMEKGVLNVTCNGPAFAAIRDDQSVSAWGDPRYGGDVSLLERQLTGVASISASSGAFVALRLDGSVVAWGDPDFGGDCSAVETQLAQGTVKSVGCTRNACAALMDNKSVVSWGDPCGGGDSSTVDVRDVITVTPFSAYFIATTSDETMVIWGTPLH